MGTHTEFRLVPWGSDGTLELLESIWRRDKFPCPFPKESMTDQLSPGGTMVLIHPCPRAYWPQSCAGEVCIGEGTPIHAWRGFVLWGGLLGSQAGTWWGGCFYCSSQGVPWGARDERGVLP